jgi:hypothetical protein
MYVRAFDCFCLQIKGTVLLMPNGSDLVTSAPLQTIQTDKKVSGCQAAGFWYLQELGVRTSSTAVAFC